MFGNKSNIPPDPKTDVDHNRLPAGRESFSTDATYQKYINDYKAQEKANNEKSGVR
jgi:hypothetical protein